MVFFVASLIYATTISFIELAPGISRIVVKLICRNLTAETSINFVEYIGV
jgi:hypothetical protein